MEYKVKSNTDPNTTYLVQVAGDKPTSCSCPAGQRDLVCVHMRKVQNTLAQGATKSVNAHLVTLTRGVKAYIEDELGIGDDVVLLIKGTVEKAEDSDNHDGTVDRTYKVKPVLAERIKDKLEQ